MFKKIFIDLCNKNGITPSAACLKVGITPATFSGYTEKSIPRQATLQRIADYFNVSIEYLKGKEIEKPSDEPKAEIVPFNENEEKLLECFRACDLEGQIKILNTAIEQRDAREKIATRTNKTNA